VSTGTFSSAQYVTDDKGNVTQVNVGGPEGLAVTFSMNPVTRRAKNSNR
jgi:hypothetical protein